MNESPQKFYNDPTEDETFMSKNFNGESIDSPMKTDLMQD